PLDAQHDLDADLGRVVAGFADRPRPVRALAPGRPGEADVGPHPGRHALARQAVRGLPRQVAEQHVDLEPFLQRLAFEEAGLEGLAQRADDVDEDMVEHLRSEGSGSVLGVENVWLERRVLNYAHQGGAAEAPSSTLFALSRAVSVGADALELDVHATADGELVVCHDATVDATTEGSGAIADMTMAEVAALDNGYRFTTDGGATFPYRGRGRDFGVATLRSVLEQFPSVFLNLDIKQTAPDVKPYESALAGLLRSFGRVDDVI